MTDEEWRDIPGWPYQVSNLGRVRRVHLVKPIRTEKTYERIALSRGRRRQRSRETERAFFVHRLVAEAFIGPCPTDKSHVAHKDGNPRNNKVENLYWATPLENAADRKRHGTYVDGERHHCAKVSNEDARIIRARYHLGKEKIAQLARLFWVNESVISNIVNSKTYVRAGGYGT